jgi:hypothetical protein
VNFDAAKILASGKALPNYQPMFADFMTKFLLVNIKNKL